MRTSDGDGTPQTAADLNASLTLLLTASLPLLLLLLAGGSPTGGSLAGRSLACEPLGWLALAGGCLASRRLAGGPLAGGCLAGGWLAGRLLASWSSARGSLAGASLAGEGGASASNRRGRLWCALSAPPTSPSELLCTAVLHSHAQVSDMPLRGVPPTNKGRKECSQGVFSLINLLQSVM